MTAASTADSTRKVSSEKSAWPGVSTRLITLSRYSNWMAALVTEIPRACSIAIQSDTVPRRPALPWVAPAVVIARACSNSASVRVDFPASGCEITANVRRRRASESTSGVDRPVGCVMDPSFTGDSGGRGDASAAAGSESFPSNSNWTREEGGFTPGSPRFGNGSGVSYAVV